ncbi:pentatricopeptide repeat-containing protein At3g29230-like isoform X1 [Primulina tabacum]|uniref:pentatricopeptide repeat-containing protein At3g29230-like isoform X1 n=3 Tax=Primulina tabacum TaxID=48773 RepID=UPI003F5942E7
MLCPSESNSLSPSSPVLQHDYLQSNLATLFAILRLLPGKHLIFTSNQQYSRSDSLAKCCEFCVMACFFNFNTIQPPTLKMLAPVRSPAFFSKRRFLELKIADLDKCTNINELKQLHALIYKYNLHMDPFVAQKLISALSLCCQTGLAINVFDQVPYPDTRLCSTLIKAHVRNSDPLKAFDVFNEMLRSGISPDNWTYLFLLKACSRFESVRMIHAHVEKLNLYLDLFLCNSLIDAYSKFGIVGIRAARHVFDAMDEKDVVTYNSMINGLVRTGSLSEAKNMFDEMPNRDKVSWNTILDGYVKAGKMSEAFALFERMPSRDVISWSTVISGFAKLGDIEMARVLFDKMPVKNSVPWTIIISGYAEMGLVKEAIELYDKMEEGGFNLDDGTFVCILSASVESGSICLGKRVHRSIIKSRHKCSILVSNALIDMYGKCGSLNKAWAVFNAMERKNVVSWNTMIHGLAMHGYEQKALHLFARMKQEGCTPDKVTFVGVLSACTHAGMVKEGICYFYGMKRDYRIVPEIQHYGCLIDLLGRGGRLSEAFQLVLDMPFDPNVVIWGSLLGACRMHNDAFVAEKVLNLLMKLEPINAGNFSLLSNIYAASGDWGNFSNTRSQMQKADNKNPSGVSSIELDDGFHEFTIMDVTHPKSNTIYQLVNGLSQHLKKIDHATDACV